jgi:hypothetical protein
MVEDRSKTGREAAPGKSTDARIWTRNRYQPHIHVTKVKEPAAAMTAVSKVLSTSEIRARNQQAST